MPIKQHIPKPVKTFLLRVYSRYYYFRRLLKSQKYLLDVKRNPPKELYYCSCCGNRVRTFVNGSFALDSLFYNPKRYQGIEQEVVCPICDALPRHRILALWFSKHIGELHNKSILYFACEFGIKMWFKRNHIKVITADYYASADLKLNICNIDQPDNSWDWIVCNHVLEHVDNYQSALQELYRILKPGGTLIISFPILSSLSTVIEETEHTDENKKKRVQLYGQADHLRIFGTDSETILSSVGFKVSTIDGSKMDKSILPVVGPADYDVNYLFLCKKPKDDNQ